MRIIAELNMRTCGSWNGKWSGEGDKYTKVFSLREKDKKYIGDYNYRWDDGWSLSITIREANPRERVTNRFSGYEWMIKSIKKYDGIYANEQEYLTSLKK
jgi:hypothetical protein